MALDTRNKRSSAIHVGLPWRGLLPAPDGALDQADRQHAGLMYAGILATAAVIVVPTALYIVPFEDRTYNHPPREPEAVYTMPYEDREFEVLP